MKDLKNTIVLYMIYAIILSFMLGMFLPGCKEFHDEVGEKLKNDPRPIGPIYNYSHPNQWPKK